MQYFKEYDNGLKLVVKNLPGILSVSTGIFVGAGSADEDETNNGISHYIEHMLFKGTKKRTSFEIADRVDSIGAQINAFTTKETTCYYTKSTAEHAEDTFEILSDLFFNSLFDEKESEKEKKVILEEISMVQDSPDDVCIDLLSQAFFGSHPLGKPIIGYSDVVKGFSKTDAKKHMDKYYVPSNIVVSVAGSLSFEDAVKLTDKYFSGKFRTKSNGIERYGENEVNPGTLYKFKDIEQVHMCIGFPSEKFDSKNSNEIALINNILGGGMSSRLFQKIREEKGLAYNVYSYPSAYRNSGLFTIYAAVNPKSVKAAAEVIFEEIRLFAKESITPEEFKRGKEQLKSSLIFGQESSSSIMNAYGKYMSMTGKLLNIDKKLKEINDLTMDDINRVLKQLFDFKCICSSYAGKEDSYFNINSLV